MDSERFAPTVQVDDDPIALCTPVQTGRRMWACWGEQQLGKGNADHGDEQETARLRSVVRTVRRSFPAHGRAAAGADLEVGTAAGPAVGVVAGLAVGTAAGLVIGTTNLLVASQNSSTVYYAGTYCVGPRRRFFRKRLSRPYGTLQL